MSNVVRSATAAIILTLGMILSAFLLSLFRPDHEQTIEVKGYAEKDVVSDVGKFSYIYRARSGTLKESYEALQKSRDVASSTSCKKVSRIRSYHRRPSIHPGSRRRTRKGKT